MKKLRKKRKKRDTKDNKTDKTDHKVVTSLKLELIPLQPQPQIEVDKKREKPETYLESPAIIIIRKVTIPSIAPSQKTSWSLNNLHTCDC